MVKAKEVSTNQIGFIIYKNLGVELPQYAELTEAEKQPFIKVAQEIKEYVEYVYGQSR